MMGAGQSKNCRRESNASCETRRAKNMQMTVNIAGQASQITLGQNKALWPLFETIVNSIQSLEDTKVENKRITIEATRLLPQFRINMDGKQTEEPARFDGFVITDNGNGFNTENYNSFMQAYSQLKLKKGCKGIGRFLWLKAFEMISIKSTYQEDGKWYSRCFDFSLSGIDPENNVIEVKGENPIQQTIVSLSGFFPRYRDAVAYGLESLGRRIIEHCLPYFIMGDCPTIDLKDNRGDTIQLNKYFENTYKDSLIQDAMELKGKKYKLYHMLLSQGADNHELHLCANNREVKPIDLTKRISNLEKGKKLSTEEGDIFYVGYVAGDYLDQAINVERSEFQFDDLPLMENDLSTSEEDIVNAAVELVKGLLKPDLEKVDTEKRMQIDRLVQTTRPQYRFLLNKRPEVYDSIPSGLADDKVDLELFKCQQKWEYDTARQRKDIDEKIKQNVTNDTAFQLLFDEYCKSITDLSRAGLAEYVIRRKAVIDLLEQALEMDGEGKYSKESRLHSIICPMQVSSDEIQFDEMNLWLIDDRLAYHHYLASDKKINTLPVLESNVDRRMDIAIFDAALSYTADSENINSITIVELKRPMRNDLDKEETDPITQVYDYVTDIKEGRVKKPNGRGFGNVQNVAFYCYVIADLTPSLKKSAARAALIPMQDGEGYFGYNPTIGAYAEVISYDKLLKNAKQRNQVLFEKLFDAKANKLVHPELVTCRPEFEGK